MIIWLTGQPGAGKTTVCEYIKKASWSTFHRHFFHIDGDDIREIYQNKDYSETGRRKNIELAQNIAHFLHIKDEWVLVSLVSPYIDQRNEFKEKIGKDFIEVWVHTDEVRGREKYHVSDYQKPDNNFIELDTTNKSIEESGKLLVDLINDILKNK